MQGLHCHRLLHTSEGDLPVRGEIHTTCRGARSSCRFAFVRGIREDDQPRFIRLQREFKLSWVCNRPYTPRERIPKLSAALGIAELRSRMDRAIRRVRDEVQIRGVKLAMNKSNLRSAGRQNHVRLRMTNKSLS